MVAVAISPPLRMAVLGAPEYFSRRGRPRTPQELAEHACIGDRLAGGGAVSRWCFERDGRELAVEVAGPLIVDDNELMLQAARAGLGLA